MEKTGLVQARTPESVKSEASDILDKLGLNMSTYINMSLNQLIIQGGIPFAATIHAQPYTDREKIAEVQATMRMEDMDLTADDVALLKAVQRGELTYDEARQKVVKEVRSGR